jgi:DNA polymerase III delta prime subunit
MSEELVVWSEIYRPKTIDECILPEATKKMVKDALATGNMPSFVFSGSAGCGKTTLAKAIAKEVGADLLYINAFLEGNIDNVKNSVVSFSSSVSMEGNPKIVLLDEADGMSQKAMDSMKGVYEQFPNVRFILTTNSIAKIIDPLRSRSVVVDFKVEGKERPKLAMAMLKRIMGILKEREVEFDPKVLAELVNKFFPDFRRTLNELQKYAASGKIDTGVLITGTKSSYKDVITAMKNKDFKAVRLWVGESASDDGQIFDEIYENAYEFFTPQSIPALILLLGEYQFKACHNINQKINLASFFTAVMIQCDFKD